MTCIRRDMKSRDLLFAVFVIAVFGVLYLLSLTGKKPPEFPADKVHMAAKTKEDCKGCHAEGKSNPIKGPHPPKDQCPECHKMKTAESKQ